MMFGRNRGSARSSGNIDRSASPSLPSEDSVLLTRASSNPFTKALLGQAPRLASPGVSENLRRILVE